MNETKTPSFLPERMQILSGSALKVIAILIMLIDHTAAILLLNWPEAMEPWFSAFGRSYSLYRVCRDVGRLAFPIFCFLLVEGFMHTRNRFKYGRNLLIFACISELPWNFMGTDTWRYERQNVFFTLFLGYVAFCAIEYFREQQLLQVISMLIVLVVSYFLNADYGWRGYVFLLIMYWFRYYKPAQAIIGSCWLYYEWKACFAFLFINMYNGERGFIRGKFGKYFFYAFYPLHITILVILRRILF